MFKKTIFSVMFGLCLAVSAAELVKDGKPCAAIVIAPQAAKPAQFAALELQYHVKLMTGAELPVVKGRPDAVRTCIFIGESTGIPNSEFRNQEYLVKVEGDNIYLTGRDYGDKAPVFWSSPATYPDFWQEIGSCYAVYDFLELLGFRWYLPAELGIAFTPAKDLSAGDVTIRRTPTLEYRDMFYLNIPADLTGDTVETADRASLNERDLRLWYMRRRHGGNRLSINHSLYTYYTRFWPEKKEWFAQGYSGRPPQLCYSNPEVLRQVIRDARDFFDGKVKADEVISNVNSYFKSNTFPVFPMDNRSWCKCAGCQAQLLPEATQGQGQFSNDRASNYVFGFVNKVAEAIRESHPGKFIGAGTYAEFCYPPTSVRLGDNIKVMICLHNRMVYAADIQANDHAILDAWDKAFPDMPKNVWMYYCFPSMTARNRQLRLFPGFFASHVKTYFADYMRKNVTGMFWEPSYLTFGRHSVLFDQVEGYINWKLAWDKELDADKLFDEFFINYYGPAAAPMKQYYLLHESIFTNPANYPPGAKHQTEDIAWNKLGTNERMKQLGAYVEQAGKLAVADPYKARVELFEKGVWQYMRKGKKRAAELASLMAPTMQQAAVPFMPPAAGDPGKIDWTKAAHLYLYGGLRAEAPKRKLTARVAHDGEYLYLACGENDIDPGSLAADNLVWLNDEWESFFAKQRGVPYRQFGVDAGGQFAGVNSSGTVRDHWDFSGNVAVSRTANSWTAYLAIPLKDVVPGGIEPGEMLYFNLIRSEKAQARGCWIPTFDGYQAPERFGELYLLPRSK